ncbi:13563_t:CDS:2 [Rhizophagus irregularis]|nr:13563_t:CDS:2 [Rhizophagus irregularis]
MGYGYCVITFGSTSSFRSPVDPQLWVYATFVQAKTNKVSKTVLIYQNTNNPPLKIDDITCGNSFIIVGYSCFIEVSEISINGGRYFVQVDFTSTGSVTDIKEIRDLNITNIDHIFMSMSILFNGGYLLTIHTRINEKNDNVLGYHVLDTNKTFQGSWNLPVTIELPKFGTRYAPMPNNSVVAIKQEGTSDIWNVYYSELPSFIEDEGYFNPIIDATTPKINDTIPMQTPSLSITYESPVKLSSGNISIFEVNGKESYFRQSFNGQTMEFLSSDNNKKITINVFESTFNKPNQLYCVVIEDGFVNHKNTEEPLLGIKKNQWYILTGDSYGSVKLDIKSSKSFLNLQSEHEKKKIRDNLAIELSEAASVSPDRIKATEIYQNDQGQVVLLFSISATDDPFKSNFTMDFYFAIVDSKKFDLQIPSFIILITPVVINLVLIVKTTFGDENFRDWFKRKTGSSEEHGSSEEAGLSKETLKLIIWAGFLMFIIEDVPQLIIQVIYKLKIVNYNIIPFITLTISSLIIISGAFSKLSACC